MMGLEKHDMRCTLDALVHCSDSEIRIKLYLKTFLRSVLSVSFYFDNENTFLTGKGKDKGPKGKKGKGPGLKGKESKEEGKKAGTEEKTEAKGTEAKPV
jgi:hypothetical protein